MITEVQAQRLTRTATFTIQREVTSVFPLFGPIRKMEWASGWNPHVLYSENPEVELHMMFKTEGKHPDEPEYLWIVTRYEPEAYLIEYTVSTQNRVWFITVCCESVSFETRVTVTYSYTSLNRIGHERNQEMINCMFSHNLNDWKEAIDHYLINELPLN